MLYLDEARRQATKELFKAEKELSADSLLEFYDYDWARKVYVLQRALANFSFQALFDIRIPKTPDAEEQQLTEMAFENRGTYSDDVEDAIYRDRLILELQSMRTNNSQAEKDNVAFSRTYRMTRTVLAIMHLHEQQAQIVTASNSLYPTIEELLPPPQDPAKMHHLRAS